MPRKPRVHVAEEPKPLSKEPAVWTPTILMIDNTTMMYAKLFTSTQKHRKATYNRMRCWLRDTLPREMWGSVDLSDTELKDAIVLSLIPPDRPDLRNLLETLESLEETARKGMERGFRTHPLAPWVKAQKGLGLASFAVLMSKVKDLGRFSSVSSLWNFCGLSTGCLDNDPAKRVIRSMCFNLTPWIERSYKEDTPYTNLFRARLELETERNESGMFADQAAAILAAKEIRRSTPAYKAYIVGRLPLAHVRSRARRYVVKRILKDLWNEGRDILRAGGYTRLPKGGWEAPLRQAQ